MPSCVYRRCTNYTATVKDKNVSFHSLPKDGLMREKWLRVIRAQRHEDDWVPSKFSMVCTKHFVDSDIYITGKNYRRIKKTAVPVIMGGNASIEEDSNDDILAEGSAKNPTASSEAICDLKESSDALQADDTNGLENEEISEIKYPFETSKECALKKVVKKLKLKKKKMLIRIKALTQQNKTLKKRLSNVNYNLKLLLRKGVISRTQYIELKHKKEQY